MSDKPTLFGHQVGDGLDDERRHCQLALKLLRQMRENGAEIEEAQRHYGARDQPWVLCRLRSLQINDETAEFLEGLWNA